MNCCFCGKLTTSLDRYGLCAECSPLRADEIAGGEIWEEPELAPEDFCNEILV